MPGYAIEPSTSKPIFVFEPDTVDELYGSAFYGLKYNSENGSISMEIIYDDEPIKLPSTTTNNDYEYVHWFSSSKQLNLTWRNEDPSHLYLEVI